MPARKSVLLVAVLALLLQLLVAGAATAQVATVEVVDFDYNPRELRVERGTTVTWTNTGGDGHTVTANDGSFDHVLNPGESVDVTFTDNGDNPYFCKFHAGQNPETGEIEGMIGRVTVGPPVPPSFVDLPGGDNVHKAIAWSQAVFADGSSAYAFVGRDDLFADSLSVGGALGRVHAPLLLTPRDALEPRTEAELRRLGVRSVYLLGGEHALSAGVEQALRDKGFGVERVHGADRVGTAVEVARRFFPAARGAIVARAYASGEPTQAFVDSLGAGALASSSGFPVLLTRTDVLSEETRRYLAETAIDIIYIVGGGGAVSDEVEEALTQMGFEVVRLGGPTRVETAAIVALQTAGEEPPDGVIAVGGTNPDAWADGFPAAVLGLPIVLTAGDDFPAPGPGLLTFIPPADLYCGASVTREGCRKVRAANEFGDFPPSRDMALGWTPGSEDGPPPGFVQARAAHGAICVASFALGPIVGVQVRRDGQTVANVGPHGMDVIGFDFVTDIYGCDFGVPQATVDAFRANPGAFGVRMIYDFEGTEAVASGEFRGITHFMLAGLTGDQETGGGAEDGLGFQVVFGTDRPGELCPLGFYEGLDEVTGAHIHEGARGEDGGVVFPLPDPMEMGPGFHLMMPECVTGDAAAVDAIKADPDGHYVNIHTEAYPAGAIRGQLFTWMNNVGGARASASYASVSSVEVPSSAPSWAQRFRR